MFVALSFCHSAMQRKFPPSPVRASDDIFVEEALFQGITNISYLSLCLPAPPALSRITRIFQKSIDLRDHDNVKAASSKTVVKETAVFCTFSALINASSRREVINTDKSKESEAVQSTSVKNLIELSSMVKQLPQK